MMENLKRSSEISIENSVIEKRGNPKNKRRFWIICFLIFILLLILFSPIPRRQDAVYCLSCLPNDPTCLPCPKEGDIYWNPPLAFLYIEKIRYKNPEEHLTKPITPSPTTLPTQSANETANGKTYTNDKYGFSLKYPSKGIIQKENEEIEGECGNTIKENAEGVLVDNFFQIKIISWQKTIDDYLIQKGAKNKYELKEVLGSQAEEAIQVVSIKKGMELSSIGYPPLMYVSYIYKKNNNLFLIIHKSHPPQPINPGGCLNPKELDPNKYSKYINQEWNFEESFKFLATDNNEKTKACNQEALICPDGSAVGRTGPNCEFSPCPNRSP